MEVIKIEEVCGSRRMTVKSLYISEALLKNHL